MLKVKQLVKKIWKDFDRDAEFCIVVTDKGVKIHLPVDLKDLKQEEIDGQNVVVIDLS